MFACELVVFLLLSHFENLKGWPMFLNGRGGTSSTQKDSLELKYEFLDRTKGKRYVLLRGEVVITREFYGKLR